MIIGLNNKNHHPLVCNESQTQMNKKNLQCLYGQTRKLLQNIHNTGHLLTVQHANILVLYNNNNNNNKTITIYTYTALLQVT